MDKIENLRGKIIQHDSNRPTTPYWSYYPLIIISTIFWGVFSEYLKKYNRLIKTS